MDNSSTHERQPSRHSVSADDFCRPVYEKDSATPLGQRLVMTPGMLLDGLKECQDDAACLLQAVLESGVGLERRHGLLVNPFADRLEKLHFGVSHLLKLLWRSGLWSEDEAIPVMGADGERYLVLREPFTDGKCGGRPLPPDAPDWQRELLGLPVRQKTAAHHSMTEYHDSSSLPELEENSDEVEDLAMLSSLHKR